MASRVPAVGGKIVKPRGAWAEISGTWVPAETQKRGSVIAERAFSSVFLPYCLEQQPDGRYAVLNRDYHPVGLWTDAWLTYGDLPVLVALNITPKRAEKLSVRGAASVAKIWLYNDATDPVLSADLLRQYLARLALLAAMEVKREPARKNQRGKGISKPKSRTR